jgi:hypothetical protein
LGSTVLVWAGEWTVFDENPGYETLNCDIIYLLLIK